MQGQTRLACLTPPGAGAIATLAVCGMDAWSITRQVFRRLGPRQELPIEPSSGSFWLGRLGTEGQADQVVLAVKQAAPHPSLELHCHGGIEVVRFLSDVYVSRGVVLCSWTELNDAVALSPLRRLALECLVQAPTVRTAAILLDQYHGAFEAALQDVQSHLERQDFEPVRKILLKLVRYLNLGQRLVQPFRVVIAGPPNVGKSSLVNALAGFTRSVVSPHPGTTRDVVTTLIALEGWPVELIDTAGLRLEGDDLEQAGIDRARAALAQADLRLWVLDSSNQFTFRDPPPADVSGFIVNKIDLPPAWDSKSVPGSKAFVSAATGQGLSDLCQWIASLLNIDKPTPPGQPIPFTPELAERTWTAHEHACRNDWQEVARSVVALLCGRP